MSTISNQVYVGITLGLVEFDHLTLSGFTNVLLALPATTRWAWAPAACSKPTISDFVLTSGVIDLTAIGTDGTVSNSRQAR